MRYIPLLAGLLAGCATVPDIPEQCTLADVSRLRAYDAGFQQEGRPFEQLRAIARETPKRYLKLRPDLHATERIFILDTRREQIMFIAHRSGQAYQRVTADLEDASRQEGYKVSDFRLNGRPMLDEDRRAYLVESLLSEMLSSIRTEAEAVRRRCAEGVTREPDTE